MNRDSLSKILSSTVELATLAPGLVPTYAYLVLVKGLTNPRGMRVRVSRVRVRVKIFIPL